MVKGSLCFWFYFWGYRSYLLYSFIQKFKYYFVLKVI